MKLIKNLRELGWKEFRRKWKEGMMRITPEQLLKTEIHSYIGSILGTIAAALIFIFVYEKLWAIAIVMGFNIIIQTTHLISKLQQLEGLRRMDIQSLKDFMEEVKEENE